MCNEKQPLELPAKLRLLEVVLSALALSLLSVHRARHGIQGISSAIGQKRLC